MALSGGRLAFLYSNPGMLLAMLGRADPRQRGCGTRALEQYFDLAQAARVSLSFDMGAGQYESDGGAGAQRP